MPEVRYENIISINGSCSFSYSGIMGHGEYCFEMAWQIFGIQILEISCIEYDFSSCQPEGGWNGFPHAKFRSNQWNITTISKCSAIPFRVVIFFCATFDVENEKVEVEQKRNRAAHIDVRRKKKKKKRRANRFGTRKKGRAATKTERTSK